LEVAQQARANWANNTADYYDKKIVHSTDNEGDQGRVIEFLDFYYMSSAESSFLTKYNKTSKNQKSS